MIVDGGQDSTYLLPRSGLGSSPKKYRGAKSSFGPWGGAEGDGGPEVGVVAAVLRSDIDLADEEQQQVQSNYQQI